ncbi:ribosome maturation factor RimM [Thioalkalivibrio sp. XN279]|uniref:ribosome maturation factor RimM n=1 Tax=Thioalkalivibrio sp. XN279 TaxID=2714953 RepID=UPI00140BC9BA|nr:ribosome maturation factor RimM [Thioalkalivibrio sp. XN279]NHA14746.1 ribosome maturation factor RimM [Thioalkalivibrio sp. XN279]
MSAGKRVILGKVGAVFGVRGWVKLWSYTDPPANLLDYSELELGQSGSWAPAKLAEARPHGEALVGRFEGVADRDAAAALVGAELAVAREALPQPGEGEFYWTDLVGLEVFNRAGVNLGRVREMMATGANDVMVVEGDRERLVPFLPGHWVDRVDLAGGRIVVDWDPDF